MGLKNQNIRVNVLFLLYKDSCSLFLPDEYELIWQSKTADEHFKLVDISLYTTCTGWGLSQCIALLWTAWISCSEHRWSANEFMPFIFYFLLFLTVWRRKTLIKSYKIVSISVEIRWLIYLKQNYKKKTEIKVIGKGSILRPRFGLDTSLLFFQTFPFG